MFGFSGENLTKRLRARGFQTILKQEIGWFDDQTNNVGSLCTKLATEASSVQGVSREIFEHSQLLAFKLASLKGDRRSTRILHNEYLKFRSWSGPFHDLRLGHYSRCLSLLAPHSCLWRHANQNVDWLFLKRQEKS